MKITIEYNVEDESRIGELFAAAARSIEAEVEEGTYGVTGVGDYTITHWPDGAVDCSTCGGRGHVVQ
jgi:hypothetical protein